MLWTTTTLTKIKIIPSNELFEQFKITKILFVLPMCCFKIINLYKIITIFRAFDTIYYILQVQMHFDTFNWNNY